MKHLLIYYWLRWLTAWAHLFDGLVAVLTFGMLWPWTSFHATYRQAEYQIKHLRKE